MIDQFDLCINVFWLLAWLIHLLINEFAIPASSAFVTRPGGLRAARLNPPPPEGLERDWIVIEIFFEFFELKESSQAPRIPPGWRQDS